MAKHNKTWYNNRIKEMEVALEAQAAKLQEMIAAFNAMPFSNDKEIAGDIINVEYEKETEIQDAIKSMRWARDSRNWNGADWSRHDLVTSNVD